MLPDDVVALVAFAPLNTHQSLQKAVWLLYVVYADVNDAANRKALLVPRPRKDQDYPCVISGIPPAVPLLSMQHLRRRLRRHWHQHQTKTTNLGSIYMNFCALEVMMRAIDVYGTQYL